MTARNDKALIIFSRLPIGHETKTRLAPILNETQRAELHIAMWHDIFGEVLKLSNTDIYLYWTGSGDVSEYSGLIPSAFILRRQEGYNLGDRMRNAMRDIFAAGYERAAIIGCDIPSVRAENILRSFDALNNADAVLGPSSDGGYWLIGMGKFIPCAFNLSSWGNSSVLAATAENLRQSGLACILSDIIEDIDTPADMKNFMSKKLNENCQTHKFIQNIFSVYL